MKLRWEGGPEFSPDPDTTVAVDVADSWLVEEGRTRGLDRHRRRFTRSARHPAAAEFFDQACARIPAEGRWFPRVEFHEGVFRIAVRPAPAPSSTISLWVPETPDPRRYPRTKGPDLQTLLDLRGQATRAGADEALLVSPDGMVREGALSALMWWRGNVLCTAPDEDVLPSITRELVTAYERAVFERVEPQELAGLECWSLSALHGIRPVTAWVGLDQPAGAAHRAPAWQERWRSSAVANIAQG